MRGEFARWLTPSDVVAAGTGHRPQDIPAWDTLGYEALVSVAEAALTARRTTAVIAGGALGWDTALAQAALNLGLKLLLALPFRGQESKWQKADQVLYAEHLAAATGVVYLHDVAPGADREFAIDALMERNALMVDNADEVLAFWSGKEKGGTANCVRYAQGVGVLVVNTWTNKWGYKAPASGQVVNVRFDPLFQAVTLQCGERSKVLDGPAEGTDVVRFLGCVTSAMQAVKNADFVQFHLNGPQQEIAAGFLREAEHDFMRGSTPLPFAGRKLETLRALLRVPSSILPNGAVGVRQFRGQHEFLSNFASCEVTLDGLKFRSVEAAYQAAKTTSHSTRQKIAGMYPGQAKAYGARVQLREGWEGMKVPVMRTLLRQKFAPGTDLAAQLLATGNKPLFEGNFWGDTFWGVCRGEGRNMLGRLLMELRDELRVGAALAS